MTNTGAVADHRLPLRSELCLPFALMIDAALNQQAKPSSVFLQDPRTDKFLQVLVSELGDAVTRGRAVVLGWLAPARRGSRRRRAHQPGDRRGRRDADYLDAPEPERPSHLESIQNLAKDIKDHKVQTLVIIGGNPVYDAPADLEIRAAAADDRYDGAPVGIRGSRPASCARGTSRGPTSSRRGATFAPGTERTRAGAAADRADLRRAVGDRAAVRARRPSQDKPGERLVRDTFEALDTGGAGWRESVMNGFIAKKYSPPAPPADQELPDPAQRQPARHRQAPAGRRRGRVSLRATPTTVGSPTTRGCGRPRTSSPR